MPDLSRYPLRKRAVLVGLIAEIAIVAAMFGLPPDVIERATAIAMSAINMGVLLGVVLTTEPQVTPVADPQDNLGRSLVPSEEPHPS
jgi:hypothetical protein